MNISDLSSIDDEEIRKTVINHRKKSFCLEILPNQKFMKSLKKYNDFWSSPAGTGKTYLAVAHADEI